MTSDQLPVLPPDAVLVHIGPHKTGTTAIQSTLASSRGLLREAGVYYPGKSAAHHREAMALRQFRQGWGQGEPPPDPAVWVRLAQQVGDDRGRVVISSEFLAQADEAARAQLVRDLGPGRVHILAAARNLAGIAVSNWQQVVRTYGRTFSLEEWLEKAFRRTEALERPSAFWERADPAALISRWTDVVPPDRLTVVVLDERDRRLLPTTFEQLLGLPEGLLADQRPPQVNRGLSAVETALIRQIAISLDSRLSWSEYTRTMRRGVIRRLLEVRQPGADEVKAQLPAWALEQAVVEAERSIAGLRSCGARIVGDLASLRNVSGVVREDTPIREVPIELAAEAVVGAIAVATRNSWSLDASPSRRRPAQHQTPTQRQGSPKRKAAAAKSSPRVDAIPTRELAVILAKRVRAGLGRRGKRRTASRPN